MISVEQLFIHPVKGLTPKKCDRVFLKAGHGIEGDRAFALMYELINVVSTSVPWMKKQHFAMQCDWPGLAALTCDYEPKNGILRVKRKSVELLIADTNTTAGRDRIGAFFTGYLAAIYPTQSARHPDRAPLQLVGSSAGTTRYPDREPGHLSLVSQATLDHLSEVVRSAIDARRFRPNIVLKGVPAWAEFDFMGQFQLGTAQIEITAPINRCLNIDVNPDTGERDIQLFSLLQKHFQHKQVGVLAKVIIDGAIEVGDTLIK